jgi:hypothetical protein
MNWTVLQQLGPISECLSTTDAEMFVSILNPNLKIDLITYSVQHLPHVKSISSDNLL